MASPKLTLDDLPKEARQKFGLKKPRQQQFSKDQVRTHALRVLAQIANLTQDQRQRVLAHCLKLNQV